MTLPKSLRLIFAISKLCWQISFGILPFLGKIDNVSHFSQNQRIKKSIFIILHLKSVIILSTQFIQCLFDSTPGYLIRILFYSFVVILTTAVTVYGYGLVVRVNEFRYLLKTMVTSPNGIVLQSIYKLRSSDTRCHDNILFVLILFVQLSMAIFSIIFLPLVETALVFRNYTHNNNIWLLSNCNECRIIFNVFVILIKIPMYVTASVITMLTLAIWLVFLKELNDNVKDLHNLIRYQHCNNSKQMYELLVLYYRELQLISIVLNKCLQIHFWPVAEFLWTSVLIGLAYTLIKYHIYFSINVQVVVAGMLSTALIFCAFCMISEANLLFYRQKL